MSPLAWTILGIIVVMALGTGLWIKVGPSVLTPHDGSSRYSDEGWRQVSPSLVLVMGIMTIILIGLR